MFLATYGDVWHLDLPKMVDEFSALTP